MESLPLFVSFRIPEGISDYVTIRYTNQHGQQMCYVEITQGDDILAVLVRIVGGARARGLKAFQNGEEEVPLSAGVRKGDIIDVR